MVLTTDKAATRDQVRKMAFEGKTITAISKELGISYGEARSYAADSWRGAKAKTTHRLHRLVAEADPAKREELAQEVITFVDFLYDGAMHMKSQVDNARKALDR